MPLLLLRPMAHLLSLGKLLIKRLITGSARKPRQLQPLKGGKERFAIMSHHPPRLRGDSKPWNHSVLIAVNAQYAVLCLSLRLLGAWYEALARIKFSCNRGFGTQLHRKESDWLDQETGWGSRKLPNTLPVGPSVSIGIGSSSGSNRETKPSQLGRRVG
jgi:hypothetical protein